MKKLFLLLLCITTIPANAANMCVRDTGLLVALDPMIQKTSSSHDGSTKTWSITFPYGVVSGIAACSPETRTSSDIGIVATDQSITQYTTGNYCYCKMLRPIPSLWISVPHTQNHIDNSWVTGCERSANYCAGFCDLYIGAYAKAMAIIGIHLIGSGF